MIHSQQLHMLDRSANSSFLVESQLSFRHYKLPEWSTWVMELGTSIPLNGPFLCWTGVDL